MHAQKFIATFRHLTKLIVSCVYEPYAPLEYCEPGQVDSLRLILEKKVSDAYLERLSSTLRGKELRALHIMSVFKFSDFLASGSLDAILDNGCQYLEELVIKNMRGYSPISLL